MQNTYIRELAIKTYQEPQTRTVIAPKKTPRSLNIIALGILTYTFITPFI